MRYNDNRRTKQMFYLFRKAEPDMDTTLSVMILCEVMLVLFIVWGLLHEQSFVRVEHAAARTVGKWLRAVRRRRAAAAHRAKNRRAVYSPAVTAGKRGAASTSRAA